jgi:hypothetical protein
MTHRYNGSQVLFRRAQACSLAAKRHADQAGKEIEGGHPGVEPRQRETDAVIETVILTQAAAESYVNWIYLQAGVEPRSSSWIPRWGGLRTVAQHLGRGGSNLPSEHRRFFDEVNAWRNYLLHGDEKARSALLRALTAQGRRNLTDEAEVIGILDSDYAAAIITRADAAFRWAAQQTGSQPPFTRGAWIGTCE